MTGMRSEPPDSRLPVSIVICTRNRCALLDRCLASVMSVDGLERAEVIVVDNGSTDATRAVIETWFAALATMRGIHEPETGLSHARNTGLRHARGDIVAFLDDDTLVERGWLNGLVAAYERWPAVAGVAGRIELAWPKGRPSWLPASRDVWFALLDLGREPRLLDADEFPVGANMSVRRDVAVAAGGFDPDLGYSGTMLLGNEERDFFQRVRQQGHALGYEPAAAVAHVVEGRRVTRRYLFRRMYAQGRSDVRVALAGSHRLRRRALVRAGLHSFARALVRGWRNDLRRVARPGNRHAQLVEVVSGRAKPLGAAREAVVAALRRGVDEDDVPRPMRDRRRLNQRVRG